MMLRWQAADIAIAVAEDIALKNLEAELVEYRRVPRRLKVAPIHRDAEEVQLRVPGVVGVGHGREEVTARTEPARDTLKQGPVLLSWKVEQGIEGHDRTEGGGLELLRHDVADDEANVREALASFFGLDG